MLEKQGLVKLVEECGELIQIAGKKMTRMDSDAHWDNAGSISSRMEDEIADVFAAAMVVMENFNLDKNKVSERAEAKLKLFQTWMIEPDSDLPRST